MKSTVSYVRFRALGLTLLLALCTFSSAIVPGVTESPNNWPPIPLVLRQIPGASPPEPFGTSFAVSDRHLLTAYHVVGLNTTQMLPPSQVTVILDNGSEEIEMNPITVYGQYLNDIAVLEFPDGTFDTWFQISRSTLFYEVGIEAVILGRGLKGNHFGDPSGNWFLQGPGGVLRKGVRQVTGQLGEYGLLHIFEEGNNGTLLSTPCGFAGGDSGGPTVVYSQGEWIAVGFHSGAGVQNNQPAYGTSHLDIRISNNIAWLESLGV